MKTRIFFMFYIVVILGCKPKSHLSLRNEIINIKETEFCDLRNYNQQLIKTKVIYSGAVEYWGANGLVKCNSFYDGVYLDFESNFNNSIQRKLKQLYQEYYKYNAELTVIGYYQEESIDSDLGIVRKKFGHLGQYESQIRVIDIEEIKLIPH